MAKGNEPKNKGNKKIYNPQEDVVKYVPQSELDDYLSNGWVKGGRPFTEEHKSKLSEANKGKTAWNKGIPNSKDKNAKISESVKQTAKERNYWQHSVDVRKGVPQTEESNKKRSDSLRGRKQSAESNRKRSIAKKGKKLGPMSEEKKIVKLEKEHKTKKKNKSFNTSTPEKEYHKKLLTENVGKTVLTQYKDKERYPYYCDFYIVEDDLFIELNAHWTHGPAPFDENNPEHIELLNQWKEKAKQSKFYENAIITWTVRDVEKKKTAEKNGLNYITLYENY